MKDSTDITKRFLASYEYLAKEGTVKGFNDFAATIEVSNSMMTEISKGRSNVGLKAVQNTVCFYNINAEWLLTGKGNMIKDDKIIAKSQDTVDGTIKYINLYDVSASAGFGSFDEMISKEKVLGKYVVPDFRDIDWMIYVKGSSMYPKYSSGDIIACRVLHESKFIQWGKVYVVATREQGMLVKRLKRSDKDEYLLAISDNPSYEPFDIPKDEILGIALVVGVIRLE